MLSALLGVLASATVGRATGPTGHILSAWFTPPTHGTVGEYSQVTCGWHTSVCDSTTETGASLDWIAGSDYRVFFRGWFKRHNASLESNRLTVETAFVSGGPTQCDVFAANLRETHSGKVIVGMWYTHATRVGTSTALTTNGGSSLGQYNQGASRKYVEP